MKTDAELAAIFDGYADTQIEWLGANLFGKLYRALDEAFRDASNQDALRDCLDKLRDVAKRLPPTDKAICRIVETCTEIGDYGMFVSKKTADANIVARLDPKLHRAIRRAVKLIAPRVAHDTGWEVKMNLGLAKLPAEPHILAEKWVHSFLVNVGLSLEDADDFGGAVATQLVQYGRTPPTPEELKTARENLEKTRIAYELSGETDDVLKAAYQERIAEVQRLMRAASRKKRP